MSDLPHMSLSSAAQAEKLRLNAVVEWLRAKRSLATIIRFGWSLAGVAIFTWLAFRLGINAAAAGFLYMIWVVLATVYGGFWNGTVTSIVAAACLDYFFFPPILHFDIADPMDWVALAAFEFTAPVISRLQHWAQVKATEARAERRDNERLYNAARGFLMLDRSGELETQMASLIRDVFELRAVLLFDALTAKGFKSGNCPPEMEQGARDAHLRKSDIYDSETETWFTVLRVGSELVGSLALRGSPMPALAAQALASVCAIALERARSFEKATRAEAARQAEQLRTAVVEAMAHEIKTPLCVVQAASSSLLALGHLSETQIDLITSIDGQATKLNDLVARLLDAAALDSAEIKPHLAPALLSHLVNTAIQGFEDRAQRERVQVSIEANEVPALVDGKLMMTALTQLVDNALKYSVQGSPVTVKVTTREKDFGVSVRNQGAVIAPADRERIFERFYRTAEARQGPTGTGLGLSIVKRIVEAHRGRIWVESGAAEGTVFNLVLPRGPGEYAASPGGPSPAVK